MLTAEYCQTRAEECEAIAAECGEQDLAREWQRMAAEWRLAGPAAIGSGRDGGPSGSTLRLAAVDGRLV